MSISVYKFSIIISSVCFSITQAQETVQSVIWNTPDGKLPNFSQTFNSEITLALSWNPWLSPAYVDASKSLLDLWITNFGGEMKEFNEKVTGT